MGFVQGMVQNTSRLGVVAYIIRLACLSSVDGVQGSKNHINEVETKVQSERLGQYEESLRARGGT